MTPLLELLGPCAGQQQTRAGRVSVVELGAAVGLVGGNLQWQSVDDTVRRPIATTGPGACSFNLKL
jgi:hypothetical protein